MTKTPTKDLTSLPREDLNKLANKFSLTEYADLSDVDLIKKIQEIIGTLVPSDTETRQKLDTAEVKIKELEKASGEKDLSIKNLTADRDALAKTNEGQMKTLKDLAAEGRNAVKGKMDEALIQMGAPDSIIELGSGLHLKEFIIPNGGQRCTILGVTSIVSKEGEQTVAVMQPYTVEMSARIVREERKAYKKSLEKK